MRVRLSGRVNGRQWKDERVRHGRRQGQCLDEDEDESEVGVEDEEGRQGEMGEEKAEGLCAEQKEREGWNDWREAVQDEERRQGGGRRGEAERKVERRQSAS